MWFRQNILKGIQNGLYRPDLDVDTYEILLHINIYINENTSSGRSPKIRT
jgi:hypothetical protein